MPLPLAGTFISAIFLHPAIKMVLDDTKCLLLGGTWYWMTVCCSVVPLYLCHFSPLCHQAVCYWVVLDVTWYQGYERFATLSLPFFFVVPSSSSSSIGRQRDNQRQEPAKKPCHYQIQFLQIQIHIQRNTNTHCHHQIQFLQIHIHIQRNTNTQCHFQLQFLQIYRCTTREIQRYTTHCIIK